MTSNFTPEMYSNGIQAKSCAYIFTIAFFLVVETIWLSIPTDICRMDTELHIHTMDVPSRVKE